MKGKYDMNAKFKISGKTIETERLVLRAFETADLEDLFEYAREEGVGEPAGWKHHESIDEMCIRDRSTTWASISAICA